MPTTDRRQAPRTKLDQVAYIHIEPDNGAIVLNASGGGLGFHSMAPVERKGPLRFSVKEQNRRLEICGELAWTDEFHKIGGVRFNTLTAEARDQILEWIRKSGAAPAHRSTLGAALLRALPANGSNRSVLSFKPALAWWQSGRRLKISGFARGLASGCVLSLLAFSLVLFCYAHRRELGESLVRLGERLGASRDSGITFRAAPSTTVPVSTPVEAKAGVLVQAESNPTISPKNDIASGSGRRSIGNPAPVRMPDAIQRSQPMSLKPDLEQTKTHEPKLSGVKSAGSGQSRSTPSPITPPSINAVIPPVKEAQLSFSKDQLVTFPRIEPVAPVGIGISPPSSRADIQMFFDLGQFKKNWMARDFSNRVAQLGIGTTVVQRGHLWMTSYQVLAGPYNNQAAEAQIKNELLSHGYKPRAYERGTRDFSFRSRVSVNRSPLPTGDFGIAWESYVTDTKVKFMQGRYLVAAVDGRWVPSVEKFSNNEYVYRNQPDGSKPLLELHFAGMDRALVLHNMP